MQKTEHQVRRNNVGIKIGIDLGTTFSAVAIMNERTGQPEIIPNTSGGKITPSVIQFTEDGEIIVGQEAKEAYEAGESGCASAFKRSMGKQDVYCSFHGQNYTAEDLSAILLRYLKEETEAVTGKTVDEAVVTVPAYFYHKERQATINAAKRAGLKVRQIINEPTAAAMNYGANHWRENARVLVYDLGGGTFDTTLVRMRKNGQMESMQTLGDHTLGGKDWDARLVSLIREKVEEDTGISMEDNPDVHQMISQAAEGVKKQLTQRNTASLRLRLPDYGVYTVSVTLEEFEQSTLDLIERTGSLCESMLRGMGLGWRDITDILLVGGSTRMRQVAAYLKRISGHTPLSQVHPDEAVALGAAIQVHQALPEYSVISVVSTEPEANEDKGGIFRFRRNAHSAQPQAAVPDMGVVGRETRLENALCVRHVDVVAHAMGVIAVNKEGTHYINKTIVPANQQIPVKCAEAFHYYTSSTQENEVEIYVLQGVKAPLECQIIGKYVVSGITHNRADNPTTIKIQYSYDVNGMIHVQARQGENTVDLPIREELVPADMSKYGRPVEHELIQTRAEPLSVMMAVDVSGSMSGEPMDDALNAMCHFVDQLAEYPGDVQIGAIAVSDRSKIVQPLTSDLNKCKKTIRSIQSCMTGVCNEGQPFDDIKSALRYEKGRKFGIVLADGMWENQSHAVKRAKDCHREGIDITGIGFGSADKKFLRDISSGDIEAMLVSQSELTQSFGKIAQEISGGTGSRHGRTGEQTAVTTWRATDE